MKRKNKILIITAIAFVITAIIFLIVGSSLAGTNILEWLSSQYAMLFYMVFGIYGLIVLFVFIGDWIKRI